MPIKLSWAPLHHERISDVFVANVIPKGIKDEETGDDKNSQQCGANFL